MFRLGVLTTSSQNAQLLRGVMDQLCACEGWPFYTMTAVGESALHDSDLDCLLLDGTHPPSDDLTLKAIELHARRDGALLAFGADHPMFDVWPDFDRDALGVRFIPSESTDARQLVRVLGAYRDHPIADGIGPFWAPTCAFVTEALDPWWTPLLWGAHGHRADPIAWLNSHGPGRIFHTSLTLGNAEAAPVVTRLLMNALRWTLRLC